MGDYRMYDIRQYNNFNSSHAELFFKIIGYAYLLFNTTGPNSKWNNLSYTANNMPAVAPATSGAKASAGMVSTK